MRTSTETWGLQPTHPPHDHYQSGSHDRWPADGVPLFRAEAPQIARTGRQAWPWTRHPRTGPRSASPCWSPWTAKPRVSRQSRGPQPRQRLGETSLLLLHVYHWPLLRGPLSEVYPLIDACGVLDDARQIFETATEQARQVAPGLMVNTLLRTGDPARLIIDEGKHACLVVLGRREDSNPTRPRRRSVTRHVNRSVRPPRHRGGLQPAPTPPVLPRVG